MKKWNTLQQMAQEVCELEEITELQRRAGDTEMGITKASQACKSAIALYRAGGRKAVSKYLKQNLPLYEDGKQRFTELQRNRAQKIFDDLLKNTWMGPFSRAWWNMRRLA